MTWKCHEVVFKADTPVHIGYRQIGILKTTRYYITSRAMWGAITANLTRALFERATSKDYQAVGHFVRKNIRTTYFYPAIKKNGDVKDPEKWSKCEVDNYLVFMPEYTDSRVKSGEKTNEGGLKFGDIPKEEFEQLFVGSFVSTALEPQTKTAEEGSLHEFEYVKNKINLDGKAAQIYWLGYVFVNLNEDISVKNREEKAVFKIGISEENDDIRIVLKNGKSSSALFKEDVLKLLFVGGERNYGLGRLTSAEMKEANNLFSRFEFKIKNGEIEIATKDTSIAHAIGHVKVDEIKMKSGEIEPLVGLEWSEKGAGQKISKALVCFTPGSKLDAKSLKLGDHGILSVIS